MAKKLNIALFNHGFPPDVGGGETQAYTIASMLHKFGHSVHVFTGKSRHRIKMPFAITYLQYFKAFEKGEASLKFFLKELRTALLPHKFDILFCSNFSSLLALSYLKDLVPGRLIFTFHCVPVKKQRKVVGHFDDWELERAFAKKIIDSAQPEITVCPSMFFYRWAREFGLPKDKLRIIYNCVEPNALNTDVSISRRLKWREQNKIPQRSFIFLTPARMLEKKGIRDIVHVARKVRQNVFFLIPSSSKNADPNFKKEIEQYVKSHRLNNCVRIVYDKYNVMQMRKVYKMCDALLLPSYYEGLPVTILEAMASNTLVVSSDITPIREAIKNGTTGLTFKVKNRADLRKALSKAVDLSENERATLTENARKMVLRRFNANFEVRALEKLFLSLVKNNE